MKKFNVKNKFSATRNLQRHQRTVHKNKQLNTEGANVSVSLNIAHLNIESVAISDLLIMPVDPLTSCHFTWQMIRCQLTLCLTI